MEKVTIGNSMYYNTSPSGKEVLKEQGKPQEKRTEHEEKLRRDRCGPGSKMIHSSSIPCSCH